MAFQKLSEEDKKIEKKGFSSILFEAGDIEYTPESQKNYSGTVIGDKYFSLDIW